jgi:hypothetical protein
LSVIVTVFATLVAALVLRYIWVGIRKLDWWIGKGAWRGTEMEWKEDGGRVVREWKRPGLSERVARLFRRKREGGDGVKSEQERFTERSRLLG